jgi:cysteine desulfurase
MAVAFDLAVAERDATVRRIRRGRDRLIAALTGVEGIELTGHPKNRLPGLASVVVRDVEGASVVVKLDLEGVAASVGSACTTGSAEPSHVLAAMGYPEDEARGSLRFSFGRATTDVEIDAALDVVPRVVRSARAAAALIAGDRGIGRDSRAGEAAPAARG